MFIIRDRTRFNSDVDTLLRVSFHIETDSSKNPAFPKLMPYLRSLDGLWEERATAHHGALYVALAYCKDLIDRGGASKKAEASALCACLAELIPVFVSRNYMTQECGAHYAEQAQQYAASLI